MKERSYSELMKSGAMNRQKSSESFVLELYIEMLLSEVLLTSKKEKLLTLIDQAIDDRNQEAFVHLSTQYRELNKQFGS
ncbi:IDEAL domain-containing protein [Bacillus sp. DNRA2]|uniref:IDEAL domain-containing protein n=1 Tax=Bacillus sp. DNRA2 TaxID=2723053 RepID=UPI00145F77FF|nr:IDEAL domain-containing protein [Bacillus sp. DNRA2]NMD70894.1 IDEAL domain-containing protein [Bacillus sp. DNRA2]